jgi:hypothetical protein
MSQEEEDRNDMAAMFSSERFQEIYESLNSDETGQIDGLTTFSNILVLANEMRLEECPLDEFAQIITGLLSGSTNGVVRNLASECISRFLNCHSSSTRILSDCGAFEVVAQSLTDFSSPETASNCITICNTISEFRPAELASRVGIMPLLMHIDEVSLPDQRLSTHAILQMTRARVTPEMSAGILVLLRLLESPERLIRSNSAAALANIVRRVAPPIDSFPVFVDQLNRTDDGEAATALLGMLNSVASALPNLDPFFPNRINFNRLTSPQFQLESGVCESALRLLQLLLPDPGLPQVGRTRPRPVVPEFGKEIQSIGERLLIDRRGRPELVLPILASVFRAAPFSPSTAFISSIASFAQSPGLAPVVLAIVRAFPDPTLAGRLGILALLRATRPAHSADWYVRELEVAIAAAGGIEAICIDAPAFDSLEQLCDYISTTDIIPIQFAMSGLLGQATVFLMSADELSPALYSALDKLTELARGVLDSLEDPPVSDPFSGVRFASLLEETIKGNIHVGERNFTDITVRLDLDFGAIECWLNRTDSSIDLAEVLARSEFSTLIEPLDESREVLYLCAPFRRSLDPPGHTRYHYIFNGRPLTTHDGFFAAAALSAEPRGRFDLTLIPGDAPRPPFEVPLDVSESHEQALVLIDAVHRHRPQPPLSGSFARDALFHFTCPFSTIGFRSVASRVIWHFPRLFTFDTRFALFRIVGFDLRAALGDIGSRLLRPPLKTPPSRIRVRATIDRGNLWADGMRVLRCVGEGHCHIDFQFAGEAGTGIGPSREFFSLFSQEFCRKRHGLWRNDDASASDFAWARGGLFPAPGAPGEPFYWLGVLCG